MRNYGCAVNVSKPAHSCTLLWRLPARNDIPERSDYILLMFSQCVVLWSASGDDLLDLLTAPNLVQLYKILVHVLS